MGLLAREGKQDLALSAGVHFILVSKQGITINVAKAEQADFNGVTHWIRAAVKGHLRKLNCDLKETTFKNIAIRELQ